MSLRLVFMGTPEFAVPTLVEIAAQGHDVAAVYTQPPRPAGRGMPERLSPVGQKAKEFGLPVLTPMSLKDPDAVETFISHKADAAIVVAYGLLLPSAILNAPDAGCLNLHASLLPRWRGAAPINRAIMAGDRETGIMVMRMEEGLDTGPVCLAERIDIGANDTAGTVHDRLSLLGADLMTRALGALERGTLICSPQPDEGACYAAKLSKDETRIDWSQSAQAVHDHIRGLAPYPGAWTTLQLGGRPERIKILASRLPDGGLTSDKTDKALPGTISGEALTVHCADGAIDILELQRSGKSAMKAEDFLRGVSLGGGDRFD